jgi:hypothetical protein
MRRLVVGTVLVAAVLVPGTASAEALPKSGGCKELGQLFAATARLPGPFGQIARRVAPVSDEVAAA